MPVPGLIVATAAVVIAAIMLNVAVRLWQRHNRLLDMIGRIVPLPEELAQSVELTETDQHYLNRTREIIHESLGYNIPEYLFRLSDRERVDAVRKLTMRLAQEYGLDDINIDINVTNPNELGAYNWNTKTVYFRIDGIVSTSYRERWNYRVHNTLKTIIHELRHAVQQKAIYEDGFWNVSEQTRCKWANSRYYYTEDSEYYLSQTIELDAVVFSEKAMEGVIPL